MPVRQSYGGGMKRLTPWLGIVTVGLAFCSLAACSDQSPAQNITGTWTDTVPTTMTLELVLSDDDGVVTGTGVVGVAGSPGGELASIVGTFFDGDVALSIFRPGRLTMTVTGTRSSPTQITGVLNGTTELSLSKQ